MKDIKGAIDLKNEYLKDKSINFPEKLKEYGYHDVEDFLNDESEYILENTDFSIEYMDDPVTQSNIVIDSINSLSNKIFIVIPQSSFIWVGKNSQYNKEYCEKNNIPVLFEPYNGGTICVNKKDLQIAITMYDMPEKFKEMMTNKVNKWINKNIPNKTVVSGNDILVNDKKVFGMGYSSFENGMNLITMQISFDVDIKMIKNICTKEMVKEPSGLIKFNEKINRDMLIKEVLTWLT